MGFAASIELAAAGMAKPRTLQADAARQRYLQQQSVTDPQLVPTAESANHISKKAQLRQQALAGANPTQAVPGARISAGACLMELQDTSQQLHLQLLREGGAREEGLHLQVSLAALDLADQCKYSSGL